MKDFRGVNGFVPVVEAGKGFTSAALSKAYGPGASLSVTVAISAYLCNGKQTQAPHFSVQGEARTTESRRNRHDPICACGCLHEDAVREWPEVAPLVALHLSSAVDGAPMHAEPNGWYWLSGALTVEGERYTGATGSSGKAPAECLRIFADHCRITLAEAGELAGRVRNVKRLACSHCMSVGLVIGTGLACPFCGGSGIECEREAFKRACGAELAPMRPRWADEACAGLAWIIANQSSTLRANEWNERIEALLGPQDAEHVHRMPGEAMPRTAADVVV